MNERGKGFFFFLCIKSLEKQGGSKMLKRGENELQELRRKKGTLYGNKYAVDMQICRWYHLNGIKQRGTKQPIDKAERGA